MDDKPFESLNMVPFIDVMLVLLTIVLLTSSFIVGGRIPLNLPQAGASEQQQEPPRVIELDAKGALYYDSRPISLNELRATLQSQDRQTPMLLRADKSITLQQFIDVADMLRQLGFGKVAVQTKVGTL